MAKRLRRYWFRVQCDLPDNPKVQRLSGDLFKAWINFLCVAGRNNGRLPSVRDTAFMLRKSAAEVGTEMVELHHAGLLDKVTEEGAEVVVPHDWNEWQYQSDDVTLRTRAWRERNKASSKKRRGNVPKTVPGNAQNRAEQSTTETESPTPNGVGPAPAKRKGFATRIPDDFEPSVDDAVKAGLPRELVIAELAKFIDHFRSVPDSRGGLKVDWPATWRNWARRAAKDVTDGTQATGSGKGPNVRRESSRAATIRTLVDIARAGAGVARQQAGADVGVQGDAAAGDGDQVQIIDLTEQVKLRVV